MRDTKSEIKKNHLQGVFKIIGHDMYVTTYTRYTRIAFIVIIIMNT